MKNISLSKLTIKNVEFFAYHGVREEERQLGGKYEVDLILYYDSTSAVLNDNVSDALNYEEAIFCISEIMNNEQYSLIETIAFEILNSVMEKFDILESAEVKVRKYTIPIKGLIGYVEAEQSMDRGLE